MIPTADLDDTTTAADPGMARAGAAAAARRRELDISQYTSTDGDQAAAVAAQMNM